MNESINELIIVSELNKHFNKRDLDLYYVLRNKTKLKIFD